MKATIEISDETLASLLCNCREGGSCGSGYWADFIDCPYDWDRKDEASTLTLALPAKIRDIEADKPRTYTLNRRALQRGLDLLPGKAPLVLAAILREDIDGPQSDVFLQLCLFGDVIYG